MATTTKFLPISSPIVTKDGRASDPMWAWMRDLTTQAAASGSGSVTHTGALTLNHLVIGNAGADLKVLAGMGTADQVLTSNGASLPPSFQDIPPPEVIPHYRTGTVNNADFKALPTSAIEIVPAPGANLMLLPLWCILSVLTPSGVYTNVDTAHGLTVIYAASDAFTYTGSFTGAAGAWFLGPYTQAPNVEALTTGYPQRGLDLGATNTAFLLTAWNDPGNYTGGGVSNSLRWMIAYNIVNPSTGVIS